MAKFKGDGQIPALVASPSFHPSLFHPSPVPVSSSTVPPVGRLQYARIRARTERALRHTAHPPPSPAWAERHGKGDRARYQGKEGGDDEGVGSLTRSTLLNLPFCEAMQRLGSARQSGQPARRFKSDQREDQLTHVWVTMGSSEKES